MQLAAIKAREPTDEASAEGPSSVSKLKHLLKHRAAWVAEDFSELADLSWVTAEDAKAVGEILRPILETHLPHRAADATLADAEFLYQRFASADLIAELITPKCTQVKLAMARITGEFDGVDSSSTALALNLFDGSVAVRQFAQETTKDPRFAKTTFVRLLGRFLSGEPLPQKHQQWFERHIGHGKNLHRLAIEPQLLPVWGHGTPASDFAASDDFPAIPSLFENPAATMPELPIANQATRPGYLQERLEKAIHDETPEAALKWLNLLGALKPERLAALAPEWAPHLAEAVTQLPKNLSSFHMFQLARLYSAFPPIASNAALLTTIFERRFGVSIVFDTISEECLKVLQIIFPIYERMPRILTALRAIEFTPLDWYADYLGPTATLRISSTLLPKMLQNPGKRDHSSTDYRRFLCRIVEQNFLHEAMGHGVDHTFRAAESGSLQTLPSFFDLTGHWRPLRAADVVKELFLHPSDPLDNAEDPTLLTTVKVLCSKMTLNPKKLDNPDVEELFKDEAEWQAFDEPTRKMLHADPRLIALAQAFCSDYWCQGERQVLNRRVYVQNAIGWWSRDAGADERDVSSYSSDSPGENFAEDVSCFYQLDHGGFGAVLAQFNPASARYLTQLHNCSAPLSELEIATRKMAGSPLHDLLEDLPTRLPVLNLAADPLRLAELIRHLTRAIQQSAASESKTANLRPILDDLVKLAHQLRRLAPNSDLSSVRKRFTKIESQIAILARK